MSKKDGFWDSLFETGALIGGAWIAAEIIKALSKKVYHCPNPNCRNIVQEGVTPCPYCGVVLSWRK